MHDGPVKTEEDIPSLQPSALQGAPPPPPSAPQGAPPALSRALQEAPATPPSAPQESPPAPPSALQGAPPAPPSALQGAPPAPPSALQEAPPNPARGPQNVHSFQSSDPSSLGFPQQLQEPHSPGDGGKADSGPDERDGLLQDHVEEHGQTEQGGA